MPADSTPSGPTDASILGAPPGGEPPPEGSPGELPDEAAHAGAPGAAVTGAAGARPVGVTASGVGALLAGALLPTAFSAQTLSGSFTPKYLVLLLVGAFGVVPLAKLARSSHVSLGARAAIVFLAVGFVSALLSQAVNIGFFGLDSWGTGWLFWLGCAGAFAIGARMTSGDLNWALAGIVLGALANALVAVYQILKLPGGALALYQGSQADGLLGNPIHLEAVLVGGLALIARRASLSKERMAWWPIVLLLAVALEFTLERVGVLLMVVVIVAALVAYGWRRAAPFGLLALAGWGIGYLSGGSGLATRVASGTAETTFGTRLRIWDLALRSTVHHPLFGVGPGELLSVVAPHVSKAFAKHLGPGLLPVDSHNFLIEVLATTGVLGFVAFVTWLGGAGLRARGPFLGCAVLMLAVELIEPLNLGVTPVALLALGAATVSVGPQPVGLAALRHWLATAKAGSGGPSDAVLGLPGPPVGALAAVAAAPDDSEMAGGGGASGEGLSRDHTTHRSSLISAVITLVLVVGALFLGMTMVVGDHYSLAEYTDFLPAPKLTAALDANRLLPYWPQSASAVAGAYQWQSELLHTSRSLDKAQPYVQDAINRDPADPVLRADAGDLQLLLDNPQAAQRYYLQSLERDPWTAQALIGLGTVARDDHEWAASARWFEKAQAVSPPSASLAHEISSDRAHLAGGS